MHMLLSHNNHASGTACHVLTHILREQTASLGSHPALLWQAAHGFIILAHTQRMSVQQPQTNARHIPATEKTWTAACSQPAHIDIMLLQHFSCIAAVILLLQTHATPLQHQH
jgi:hypothetical protein